MLLVYNKGDTHEEQNCVLPLLWLYGYMTHIWALRFRDASWWQRANALYKFAFTYSARTILTWPGRAVSKRTRPRVPATCAI